MNIIFMFFVIFSEQDHLQLNSLSDLTNSLSQMQEIDLVSIICGLSICLPLVCLSISLCLFICLSVCLYIYILILTSEKLMRNNTENSFLLLQSRYLIIVSVSSLCQSHSHTISSFSYHLLIHILSPHSHTISSFTYHLLILIPSPHSHTIYSFSYHLLILIPSLHSHTISSIFSEVITEGRVRHAVYRIVVDCEHRQGPMEQWITFRRFADLHDLHLKLKVHT